MPGELTQGQKAALLAALGIPPLIIVLAMWLYRQTTPGFWGPRQGPSVHVSFSPSLQGPDGGDGEEADTKGGLSSLASPDAIRPALIPSDAESLGEVLWLECRGQKGDACLAKGYVYLHRWETGWGETWEEVLDDGAALRDGTDVWPGHRDWILRDDPLLSRLRGVAASVVGGLVDDPCPGAVFYVDGDSVPPGPEREPICVIGGSRFYR